MIGGGQIRVLRKIFSPYYKHLLLFSCLLNVLCILIWLHPPNLRRNYCHDYDCNHNNGSTADFETTTASPAQSAPNASAAAVDFLLNLRKLSLFAVRELNARVPTSRWNRCAAAAGGPDRKSRGNCPKWWTNPLNAILIGTTQARRDGPKLHKIVFVADPGRVKFKVTIVQRPLPANISAVDLANFEELSVIGNFKRMDSRIFAHIREDLPPEQILAEDLEAYNARENSVDPELDTWKRHDSFWVGDYVDFNDTKGSLYTISPKNASLRFCGNGDLKLLIMVVSAPANFERRTAIRETYGSDRNLAGKGVRVLFRFGRVQNDTLQKMLEAEATAHDDMVQADFLDSYHNLTLSRLLMYHWLQQTCEKTPRGLPRHVLKADDDFLINVDLALRVASENPDAEMMGFIFCGTSPVRLLNKFYAPKYIFAADFYPGYLSGSVSILRTDIIPRLLKISLTTPLLHIEDVYVTGILPRQLGVTPRNVPAFSYERIRTSCALRKVVGSQTRGAEDIRTQWNMLRESSARKPRNCSLDDLDKLVLAEKLSPQANSACMFEKTDGRSDFLVPTRLTLL